MVKLIKIVQFPILMPSNSLNMLNEINIYKKVKIIDYKLISKKYIYEVFELENE